MNNGEKVQADYKMLIEMFESIGQMRTPERLTYDDGEGYRVYSLGKGPSGKELKIREYDARENRFAIDYGSNIDIQYRLWPRSSNRTIKFEVLVPGGAETVLCLDSNGRYTEVGDLNLGEPDKFRQLLEDDNCSIKEVLEKLIDDFEIGYHDCAEEWLSLYNDIEELATTRSQLSQQAGTINPTKAVESALRNSDITAVDVQRTIIQEEKAQEESDIINDENEK